METLYSLISFILPELMIKYIAASIISGSRIDLIISAILVIFPAIIGWRLSRIVVLLPWIASSR